MRPGLANTPTRNYLYWKFFIKQPEVKADITYLPAGKHAHRAYKPVRNVYVVAGLPPPPRVHIKYPPIDPGTIFCQIRSDYVLVNGYYRIADLKWKAREVGTVVLKYKSSLGGPAVWVNGIFGSGVTPVTPLTIVYGRRRAVTPPAPPTTPPTATKFGAVGFSFSFQTGTVDNVEIKGILDMAQFNEKTKNVR